MKCTCGNEMELVCDDEYYEYWCDECGAMARKRFGQKNYEFLYPHNTKLIKALKDEHECYVLLQEKYVKEKKIVNPWNHVPSICEMCGFIKSLEQLSGKK